MAAQGCSRNRPCPFPLTSAPVFSGWTCSYGPSEGDGVAVLMTKSRECGWHQPVRCGAPLSADEEPAVDFRYLKSPQPPSECLAQPQGTSGFSVPQNRGGHQSKCGGEGTRTLTVQGGQLPCRWRGKSGRQSPRRGDRQWKAPPLGPPGIRLVPSLVCPLHCTPPSLRLWGAGVRQTMGQAWARRSPSWLWGLQGWAFCPQGCTMQQGLQTPASARNCPLCPHTPIPQGDR